MKKIIVDLANIKSVVEAQNRFWGPFNITAKDVPFKNPSWDAFRDYFSFDLPTDENDKEPIHLILKGVSTLKRISEEDYEILIKIINEMSDKNRYPWTRFTYELVEDK